MFPKLPKSVKRIDAIYQRPDGFMVIFIGKLNQYSFIIMLIFLRFLGKQFWVYDGHDFVENSPQPLSKYGLPEYVHSIDAVQNWSRNSK